MKCPQCEAEVHPGSVYCSKCGERLQGPQAEAFPELKSPAQGHAAGSSSGGGASGGGEHAPATAAASPSAPTFVRQAEALADDAQTLWEGRYCLKGMIDRLALSVLVTIGVVALAIVWPFRATWWRIAILVLLAMWLYQFVMYAVRRWGHRYRLTPQTLFHERGILFKSTSPIEIVGIDDISLNQSILERLVGVGTIRILSNDTTDPLLVLKGIPDVRRAFETIDQARRAERRRRAVRIDNV